MTLSSDFRFFKISDRFKILHSSEYAHEEYILIVCIKIHSILVEKTRNVFQKWKMQNFEKIQLWILRKRFITGQWKFSCRYMLRSSPSMQNLMIVRHIVWLIRLKKQFFAFFWLFLGIFSQKLWSKLSHMAWNFARRWPWCLATCVQNLKQLAQRVWP